MRLWFIISAVMGLSSPAVAFAQQTKCSDLVAAYDQIKSQNLRGSSVPARSQVLFGFIGGAYFAATNQEMTPEAEPGLENFEKQVTEACRASPEERFSQVVLAEAKNAAAHKGASPSEEKLPLSKIADTAFTPITKEDSPKLYASWGKKWIGRINAALEKAVAITATSPKCDRVFLSGYSFDRSVPKQKFSVFVDCSNGERFFYTEAEARDAKAASRTVSEGLDKITDTDSLKSCETAAKKELRFPSTMDVSWFGSNVERGQFGISVTLSFEAKNGLGNELPYAAYCVVNNEGTELLSVKER
jgi:hypothetical protein